jgi:hypothetical protein
MSHYPRFAALMVGSLVAPVQADTLLAYSFDTSTSAFINAPSELAAGVSAGAWTDLDGTLISFAGNPGRALGAKSFHDGNSLGLRLSADTALLPTRISFDQQASASGPREWSLAINGRPIASGLTSTSFGSVTLPLSLSAQRVFELALSGTGASSSVGTWRIDNFRLEGTQVPVPVPVPAPVGLLASGLVWLRCRAGQQRQPKA